VHFFRLYQSSHGIVRMFFFHIQALVRISLLETLGLRLTAFSQYNVFSLIFTWFALANLWLTFSIVISLAPSQGLVFFGTQEIASCPLGPIL
jgi:chitin synthase